MTKSARKTNKIHWSQLAANGSSSQPAHCQNGRRANEDYLNDTMKRKQVKVILTDVLLTEAGQNYLSRCRQALNTKTSELERGARERQSERRLSVEHGNGRQASAAHKDQAKSSPVRPSNGPSSKKTDVACTEENNKHLSKEIKSPPAKRLKTLKKTLKQTEPANSDENSSCSLEESNSLPSKLCNNLLVEHTTSLDFVENKSCPVDELDSLRPTTASLPPSERNDSDQISESNVIPTRGQTPLRTKQPRRLNSVDNQNSESEHKTSESEIQVHAKNMMKKDGDNKQVTSTEEALHRNGELPDEEGGARGSVLRLSTGASEGKIGTEMGSSEEEVLPKCSQNQSSVDVNPCSSAQVEVRNASHTTEPIVLSSEEEEEDSSTSHIQSQEGAKDPHKQHKPAQVMERKLPDPLLLPSEIHSQASSFETSMNMCPVMELQFSAIYMSGLSVLTSGYVKITDDQITFSVKDPSGSDVKTFVATMHVHKYSVWDSGVFKERKAPTPSVLLLWVSETQLRRLFNELSIVQPGTRPAEGSTCVALCVCQPLNGVQGALLASIMDIVGLRHGTTDLLSPLPHHESLKILQNSRDVHLLQLLHPKMDTQTVTQQSESAPTSAGSTTTTAKSQDSDAQMHSVYTLCHSRAQGTYSVSLARKPAADWTRYQHCGPARRLIQFPPPPCKGAITVTTEDLECLDSGEFLNDVIIDFYLKYLLFQKAPRVSVKRSHVFSSFFYKQLTRRDNANEDSTSTPAQLRRHQRVRTWTRHVDIFEKDFLFVPVNQEAHWYLVVVCFPGLDEPQHVEREDQTSVQDGNENSDPEAQSESQQGDGERDSDEKNSRSHSSPPNCTESTCKRQTICKRPCILIMDSLKLSVHERIFKLLREYLQAEWEVKRGGYRDFSAERMVGSHCRVPLQDNSSDCGLYLLQYAESFLLDPVVHFDLPLRLECWFPRQKVREKREEIRDLVLHLYQFQQGSRGNDSSLDSNEMENTVQ